MEAWRRRDRPQNASAHHEVTAGKACARQFGLFQRRPGQSESAREPRGRKGETQSETCQRSKRWYLGLCSGSTDCLYRFHLAAELVKRDEKPLGYVSRASETKSPCFGFKVTWEKTA